MTSHLVYGVLQVSVGLAGAPCETIDSHRYAKANRSTIFRVQLPFFIETQLHVLVVFNDHHGAINTII